MAIVTELVTKFSFQGSTAPLGKYNQELGESVTLLASVVAGLVAASGAISLFVVNTLSGADSIGQLAKETGVGVETIQELGFAASVSGSSVAALEGTLDSLSQTIGDAAQKGSDDFTRLGISVRGANGEVKNADVILGEVSRRFRALNLSLQEQKGFAAALGIDTSLIQLLNKTSAEMFTLRNRARDLGLVNAEQQKNIIEFNDSLTILKFGLSSVQKQVAIGLSPTIKSLADDVTSFLVTNKELVADGLIAVGDGINVLLDGLGRLKFVIGGMLIGFIALKVAAIGLGGVLAVIFSPVVLITAGIVGLLLIIDDLIVAFRGGDSVIRDFFQTFLGFDISPILQKWVADFISGVGIIKDVASTLWSGIVDIAIADFQRLKDFFISIFDFIGSGIGKISGLVSSVAGFLGIGETTVSQNLTPGPATTQNTSIDNRVTQSNTFDIRTDDPQAAADAVGVSLQRQLEDANVQLDRGGR